MPDSQVEEIKSRLNIVDVIADYVQLKKAGVNFRARCPFHSEKTPSFYVTPARQIWHCFGCGLGGDIFEFIKQIESVDFPQALERLAEKAGIVLERRAVPASERPDRKKVLYTLNDLAARYYQRVLSTSRIAEEARDYLKRRKFSPATLAQWRLGYAPEAGEVLYQFLKKKGFNEQDMEAAGLVVHRDQGGGYFDRFRDRITFPIIDMAGRTVGFSARILHPKEGTGKYINSPESPIYSKSDVMFGLYQARNEIRRKNAAVIVEGNADVVKSQQAGVANVVASSGTALTERQLTKLSRLCEELIFSFDADAAGLTATRRALDLALEQNFRVKLITLPAGAKDPDELIDKDQKLWPQAIEQSADYLEFYFHKLFDILNLQDAHEKKKTAAEFIAILSKVPDSLVRAHYVRKIAETLSVKEALVADLLARATGKKTPAPSSAGRPAKNALAPGELLESRFIGLLLRIPKLLPDFVALHFSEHFSDPKYRRIFEQLKIDCAVDSKIEADTFLAAHPDLQTDIQLAIFSAEMQYEDTEEALEELGSLSRRLRKNHLDRQKEQLSRAMALAEQSHDNAKRNQLAADMNSLLLKERELGGTNNRE